MITAKLQCIQESSNNIPFELYKNGQKNHTTKARSQQWLTLSKSGQWEVVGQSRLQCINVNYKEIVSVLVLQNFA